VTRVLAQRTIKTIKNKQLYNSAGGQKGKENCYQSRVDEKGKLGGKGVGNQGKRTPAEGGKDQGTAGGRGNDNGKKAKHVRSKKDTNASKNKTVGKGEPRGKE